MLNGTSIFLSINRELGIGTVMKSGVDQTEMLKLTQGLFDTVMPPGVTQLQPFSEDSAIKKISVEVCTQLSSSTDHLDIYYALGARGPSSCHHRQCISLEFNFS